MKAKLFSCLKKNPAPLAWLALHAAVFVALAQKNGRQFFVLARAKTFEGAKKAAGLFAEELSRADQEAASVNPNNKIFESLSFEATSSAKCVLVEINLQA